MTISTNTAHASAQVVALPRLARARVGGADAEHFLQGQVSNDMRTLADGRAHFGSYNNPKGRVLALFTIWRDQNQFVLETDASALAPFLLRLKMFILRAKVSMVDESAERRSLGLIGEGAAELLRAQSLPVPATAWEVLLHDDCTVIRRPGPLPRWSIEASSARIANLLTAWSAAASPADEDLWRLQDIAAGLPCVTAATREHFVAQMLDLDLLDGIGFSKGCYAGQEVIARLHYLGEVKRRLFIASTDAAAAPGDPIFTVGIPAPVGEVVDAATSTQGSQLLIVLQLAHRNAALYLGEDPIHGALSQVRRARTDATPG